jgi:glycosyltransferase involved in cell wall biosynthesis
MYVMKKIKENNIELPNKLVISGIGGNSKDELLQLIRELDIEDNIIITGFVTNEERDCLYKNAGVFLFPSIFEGFGMPPIEAMMYGTPVVVSDIEVIREVTQNMAVYVDKYFDADEWIKKIKTIYGSKRIEHKFNQYSLERITKEYNSILYKLCME